jgi:hypothetical protein
MLTATRPRAVQAERATACAVVWIDAGSALIAATLPDGRLELSEVLAQPAETWDQFPYLARVVDRIGDRERIVILGPGPERTALEREYVTIHHRPDRLIDVEPADFSEREGLVERLRQLTD